MQISLAPEALLEARRHAGKSLLELAPQLTSACSCMAQRFQKGGKLIAFGLELSGVDANHVAVEFVHPVIVGKRALPALSLANQPAPQGVPDPFGPKLRSLATRDDIALAIFVGHPTRQVQRGLETAGELGMLSVALASLDTPAILPTDHLLRVPTYDPLVARELQITLYHILWETVHVFLDREAP